MNESIILDTNILQYGVNRSLSNEVVKLLEEVTKKRPKLTIAAYTKFEVYRGLNKDKIDITRELVDKFTPLDVDDYTFRIAAVLYSCYHYHDATKGKNKYDDDGDIIIGATAIRYNTPILTANGNDFPRPFFTEGGKNFTLKRSDKAEILVQLLYPNIKAFNSTMQDCLL